MKETGQRVALEIFLSDESSCTVALVWERRSFMSLQSWWTYDTYAQRINGALSKAINRGDEAWKASGSADAFFFLFFCVLKMCIILKKKY